MENASVSRPLWGGFGTVFETGTENEGFHKVNNCDTIASFDKQEGRVLTMAEKQLRYTITIRIYGEEKCFGPGVAELLEKVDEMKSLRKATMDMGMAYSKAWRVIKVAEENLGFPLLSSVTGGRGGGGAELTPDAKRFLRSFRQFEEAVRG